MKVAIVHDWLYVMGGAEKVLAELFEVFPEAELFTLIDFLPQHDRGFLKNVTIHTSFLQKVPFIRRRHRQFIGIMPLAIEQFDFSQFDLVISSSSSIAKGIITGPRQVHISYVHSPMRYAWDQQAVYLKEARMHRGLKSAIARILLHYLRMWDFRTAHGPDLMIANSAFVARRIKKTYGVDAKIINPPVDLQYFTPEAEKQDYYVTASRMVPYKKIPLIVEAFSRMPDKKLIVIGDGPDFEKAKKVAGPNVQIMGYQTSDVLRTTMSKARAFVFAAEEDFGIIPVEAQACGTPVIAFGKGGTSETVRGLDKMSPTGVHFHEQSVEAIVEAIELFERRHSEISLESCVENARNFSRERFKDAFRALVGQYFPEFAVEKNV
ncbi:MULTISPECIES: glycosyltransferase family 4 protein [unclassified Sinorhizobium]|uniref:glycosyltransferase family 4 protein n=1 Tax=unclassified Sinorhizobium TaxID=2613772 RepID=UPI003525D0BA